jgi:outer membrane protein TolC
MAQASGSSRANPAQPDPNPASVQAGSAPSRNSTAAPAPGSSQGTPTNTNQWPTPAAAPPPKVSPPTYNAVPEVPPHPVPANKVSPEDLQAQTNLLDILDETTKSSGAIFVDPEKIQVQPPILKALITLDERLSPLQLDATSKQETNLRGTLLTAMSNNLPIKIIGTEAMIKKWGYYGALGNFLPSLTNELGFQGLHGNYVSPAGVAIPIHNPYFATSSGVSQTFYKGGSILHGALQNKYEYRASQQALKGTINDVMLDASKLYYDLVLNDVLLQIRVKAVDVSKALVMINEDQFTEGVNTKLDVLQAKYQLSHDRQELIKQQVARRQSAVNLQAALNGDTSVDLELSNRMMTKARLVDNKLLVGDLMRIALDNRPELKRYEQLRLAAKEAIKVAKATLLPVVTGTGQIISTGSNVHPINSSAGATPLSPAGVSVGSVSSASDVPLSGTATGSPRWTTHSLFLAGIDVTWNIGGLALPEIAQIQSARYKSRQVYLEFQNALVNAYKDVRDSYLSSMSAENLIIETTDAVNFSEEQLRVADTRLKEGVGTYLDVINAQRAYTDALVAKARAIIDYNTAQATLVHALGKLSPDTATAAVPLRQ